MPGPVSLGEAIALVRRTGEEGLHCDTCLPCPGPPWDWARVPWEAFASWLWLWGHWGLGPTFPPSGWSLEAHLGWGPKEENLGLSKYKNRVKWGC